MGHKFAELAFTPNVRLEQERHGSRKSYARAESGPDHHDILGVRETEFIQTRDSFYMASVSETGWPYVQHRGGPIGFLKVLDARTIGFADFRGNRQYVSVGNFTNDNRVALILMDYPARLRLKILGRVNVTDDKETLQKLSIGAYQASIERGILIEIHAFDWNCPQHITPRYSIDEIKSQLPLP